MRSEAEISRDMAGATKFCKYRITDAAYSGTCEHPACGCNAETVPMHKRPQPLTLNGNDVRFLAARLRRLFQHFGIPVPNAGNDASVIGNAGAAIGLLLAGRTDGVPAGSLGEREEALTQIAQSLSVMLGSAVALVDGMGNVVGYQIKTGALHRVLGYMAGLDHPVSVPLCRTRIVLNHESSPWPLEGTPAPGVPAVSAPCPDCGEDHGDKKGAGDAKA